MNIALWIVAGLLAAAFVAAGGSKVATPRKQLEAKMPWVADFTDGQVKAIGAVEVLGAIGLILPAAVNVAPVLVPLAAVGLALTMVGAAVVHLRRGDGIGAAVPAIVLALLCAFVAWGRFGPQPF